MGLIGGMARTAVVAGTATAVSNRVSRRQAGRWAAQEQQQYAQQPQYAPPAQYEQQYQAPPSPQQDDTDDVIAQLERLGSLRDKGILTDAEFAEQKARLLSG